MPRTQLVIVNQVNQVACRHSLVEFRHKDWPCDEEHLLDEEWSNGDDSLHLHLSAFQFVILLGVARIGGEVGIQVRVAQAPVVDEWEPLVLCRERNEASGKLKRAIQD